MTAPTGIRTALRARRTSIVLLLVLSLCTAIANGLLWAAGGLAVGAVSMLIGSWLDVRRGGVPVLSRGQAVVAGLTVGFVLTVVAVALG